MDQDSPCSSLGRVGSYVADRLWSIIMPSHEVISSLFFPEFSCHDHHVSCFFPRGGDFS